MFVRAASPRCASPDAIMKKTTISSLLRLLPWLVLCTGLVLTYLLQAAARQENWQAHRDEFNFRVNEIVDNIGSRLGRREQVLSGAVGLFAASRLVERDEFRAYVDSLKVAEKNPGMQGVGFAQVLPGHTPAGQAADGAEMRTAIVYLEPADWRNRRAFGYDMYAEPVRRAAMARARDENRSIISGKVRLIQETEQEAQPGFLMYLPVYRGAAAHDTLAARRANLLGWVYAPFRMHDLMKGILGQHFGEIEASLDLEIYDGETLTPTNLMFDSNRQADKARAAFSAVKPLTLFEHRWTVAVYSLPSFEAGLRSEKARLIAIGGGCGSVLLALALWLLVTARGRAVLIAERMTEQLRSSEANKDALFENMSSGVAVLASTDGGCTFVYRACNRAAERIDRLQRAEVIGRSFGEVLPGIADCGLPEVLQRVWRNGVAERVAPYWYSDQQRCGWREAYVYTLPNGDVVVIYDDVSARKQAEAEQARLNRALRLLSACNLTLVHADDEYKLLVAICNLIVDRGGYLMAWVGYAEHDAAKTVRPITQAGYESGYLDHIDITWDDSERGRGPTGTAIRTGITDINQDVLHNPRMAPWRAAAIERGYRASIALPLSSEGQMLGALTMYSADADAFNSEEVRLLEEMAKDLAFGITTLRARAEHAAAAEQVTFLSHFDPLTHLPNRLLLRDRFDQARRIAEHEQRGLALLYLDVDNFKQVNDSLGLEVGDQLLILIVKRLQACLGDGDTLCRLSGDEFVILLAGTGDAVSVAGSANIILDAFAEPLLIDGNAVSISFSIGISLYASDGEDFDMLLKHADTAMHHAKESGRNTCRFFTLQMNQGALEQLRLKGQLHQALKEREFLLHYQPQVAIGSQRIVGAEALVRWLHPVDGLISPARFIPLAEQSGHIIQLGEWVLNEACRQARQWLDSGLPALVMAVNLSALQFKRGDIVEVVMAALQHSGLPPALLELELTESILLQDVAATMRTLQSLKALGVKLSIDDFGTGYSSLSYLKQLAVDKLKIDQSFIRDLLDDSDDAAIVKAVIQLGQAMQLTVIAEGVETAEQLAYLGSAGCDEVQGYLFSRPIPAEQFAELLADGASPPR
jgi:diguanylate cyclase (GGDEF)-like protein